MHIVGHEEVDEASDDVYIDIVCEWVGCGERRGLHAWRNGRPGLFDPSTRTFHEGRHKSCGEAQKLFADRLLVELYTAATVHRCDAMEYIFYVTQIFYSSVPEAHESPLDAWLPAFASIADNLFPPRPLDENGRPEPRRSASSLCVRFKDVCVASDAADRKRPMTKKAVCAARACARLSVSCA